jgi:hypothetical protein
MTAGWLINIAVAEWLIRRPGIRRRRRARRAGAAQASPVVVGAP